MCVYVDSRCLWTKSFELEDLNGRLCQFNVLHMDLGEILINEIAPRPHNSGHYSIEACHSSQYANHLRALLDLPLGSTEMKVSSAAMLNLLGYSNSMTEVKKVARCALSVVGATVHLYGKSSSRKGRKLGHITIVANSDAELRDRLRPARDTVTE